MRVLSRRSDGEFAISANHLCKNVTAAQDTLALGRLEFFFFFFFVVVIFFFLFAASSSS